MAVTIRLTRRGHKNHPFFRIGVYDNRTRRDGAAIENLGYYNPIASGAAKELELNEERTRYWLSVGATPSETVASFLRKANIAYSTSSARTARNRKRQAKRVASIKARGGDSTRRRNKKKAAKAQKAS